MSKISITVAEAAALSGIGKTSLYKLIAAGKLTPRKVGTRTLIVVEELENFIRSLPRAG